MKCKQKWGKRHLDICLRLFRNEYLHGIMARGMSSNSHHEQTSNMLSRDFNSCFKNLHLFGSARLLLESKLEYIIPKYENLLMDYFLAYLADTVESHFIKN